MVKSKQAFFDIWVNKKKQNSRRHFESSLDGAAKFESLFELYYQVENCLKIEPKVRNCASNEKAVDKLMERAW